MGLPYTFLIFVAVRVNVVLVDGSKKLKGTKNTNHGGVNKATKGFCHAKRGKYDKKRCRKTTAPIMTVVPTITQTDTPTQPPTDPTPKSPTDEPTESPTDSPTESPTDQPTDSPTESPTDPPTDSPTESPIPPTNSPLISPTQNVYEAELTNLFSRNLVDGEKPPNCFSVISTSYFFQFAWKSNPTKPENKVLVITCEEGLKMPVSQGNFNSGTFQTCLPKTFKCIRAALSEGNNIYIVSEK